MDLSKTVLSIALFGLLISKLVAAETPIVRLQGSRHGPHFVLNIQVTGGTNHVLLERSTDLINWVPALDVFSRITSFFLFDPPIAPATNAALFYRAVSPGRSIGDMLSRWHAAGLSKYRYKFQRTCFCRQIILSGTVTVNNGKVVAVTDVRADQQVISNSNLADFKSIEELFDILISEIPKADLSMVGFDPSLNFPTWIDINYSLPVADEETRYETSDVEPIQ